MLHARLDIGAAVRAQPASPLPARTVDLASADDPETVAAEWERLEPRGRWPTQGHDFFAALEPLLAGRERKLLGVCRGSAIAALLPLCREPCRFARWHIAGSRDLFEPGDILCDQSADAERLADGLAALKHPLSLDRISADSPLVPALRAAMKGRGWLSVRAAMPCPCIALDARWRDPGSLFNAGRRSDFRRAARRAEAMGAVTYEMLAPTPEQFDAAFDEAIGVELQSWKRDAGSAIGVDRRRELFFRRFFHAAAARGAFRVAFMRIDGTAVAMQLALLWSGRYWLFKIGHDDRFGKCSPGTLLMLHTLRWAAEEKLASYELLGEAEPWITRFWTQDRHDCARVRTYPFTLPGMIALAADAARWTARRLLPARR